jgi:hypothetical protein
MPDYQNGKVYTIRCHIHKELIYVGSTTKTLCARWSNHKADMKRNPNTLLYSKIIEIGVDNFYIELYE